MTQEYNGKLKKLILRDLEELKNYEVTEYIRGLGKYGVSDKRQIRPAESFGTAFDYVMANPEDAILCHGMRRHPLINGNTPSPHAWAELYVSTLKDEYKDIDLDAFGKELVAKGIRDITFMFNHETYVYDGVLDGFYAKETYYDYYDIRHHLEYDDDEALKLYESAYNCGPWHFGAID